MMKNILGTLERPEMKNPHSRLFPETPSRHAMDIVSRPEWRAAIEYRVNEALYGSRNIREILFPNMPHAVPTYEKDISVQIFSEEEAVRIDREPSRNEPPSYVQIEIEETLRRPFLYIINCLEQKEWNAAERLLAGFSEHSDTYENAAFIAVARAFFSDIFSSLLPRKMREYAGRNDMASALHIIRLAHRAPYLTDGLGYDFVEEVSKKLALRAQLAIVFLSRLAEPTYNDLWRECEAYGFDMPALKKDIRTQCEHELCEVLKRDGAQEFFRWLDFAIRQEVFTEEELTGIQSLRTALLAYARGLIGKGERWVKEFRGFLNECDKANICAPEDIASSPVVRAAAEKHLLASFAGGADPAALVSAANAIHHAGIMPRNDAVTLPQIHELSITFLVRIFSENMLTDDQASQEKIYFKVVQKYVEAGIGTRTYFDNVPAIKAARSAQDT